MKPYLIYQTAKADLMERTRRFSFLIVCTFSLFLAFFSVPDTEAPLVSICMEPNLFKQGSNSSWIPITIALCGGILFPMIGLSFVKNNINGDRTNGFLYSMQAMNMKKGNYILGKFLSNLLMLTVMWLLVIIGAAIMLPFQFPGQLLSFYDFISPFIGVYPGIIFTSAFAIILESIPFLNSKSGNVIGITILFVLFLINYSASDFNYQLLGIFDFSNYKWIMDSINSSVIPIIGREVQETGILVPRGMFADSQGGQELIFHGLLWSSQYFTDKIILIMISIFLIILAVVSLETTEQRNNMCSANLHKKERTGGKTIYTNQFISEFKMILKTLPKSCFAVIAGLWIYCIFAPLNYVQNYLWIIMLICSAAVFSQMGCRDYENHLTDFFITIKFSLIKQLLYSYLWGTITLLVLSAPAIIRNLIAQNFLCSFSYIVFSAFIPALACFLGEYSKSRRTFETVYLLLCFFLLNLPSFLFQGSVIILMAAGSVCFIFTALVRRLSL